MEHGEVSSVRPTVVLIAHKIVPTPDYDWKKLQEES